MPARSSISFWTSSGGVIELMKKSVISRPYLAKSSATRALSAAPSSS